MTTTTTREHRTAIDRLALKPGTCIVHGCGETLLLVDIDPSYDPSPTERFDPKKGYPDDKAYPHGLFHAVLRDVADPAWRWLPEHMRGAAARAGFAVRVTAGGILGPGPCEVLRKLGEAPDFMARCSASMRKVLDENAAAVAARTFAVDATEWGGSGPGVGDAPARSSDADGREPG
jgi:hypothetical protein